MSEQGSTTHNAPKTATGLISRDVVPGIHLIDVQFQGQPGTIGAYLLEGYGGQAALIETGPTTTLPALLDGIRAAGVDPVRIEDVLVTHIHLDHAGGAGALLRDYLPNARVLVHPVGRPHLVDPSRLVRSAARLYGERLETLWGEIVPIPESRVVALTDGAHLRLAGHELEILFTPGHATHHVAVHHRLTNAIITGDAAGVRVAGASVINPPTVPPEFDPVAWDITIDRLLAIESAALLLTHFGVYTDARAHLTELRRRMREWIDVVRAGVAAGRTLQELADELRQRDAATPGTDTTGADKLNLIAGYDISVGGIMRYLEKQESDP